MVDAVDSLVTPATYNTHADVGGTRILLHERTLIYTVNSCVGEKIITGSVDLDRGVVVGAVVVCGRGCLLG